MKKSPRLLLPLFTLALILLAGSLYAQTPGPSDPTPSATAAGAAKVYCAGSVITLTGPQDATATPVADYAVYHWYKLDASNNPVLVAGQTGKTYTETSTTAGYYNYKLVTENANGCLSPVSTVLQVYVLPPLSTTISTTAASLCAGTSPTPTLTANPTPATPYALHYAWTKTIGGSTTTVGTDSPTYTVAAADAATAQTITYGVTVSYGLNATCTATASQVITVNPLPTQPTITAN